MKNSEDLYDLSPEQLEIVNEGKYLPGNQKKESRQRNDYGIICSHRIFGYIND